MLPVCLAVAALLGGAQPVAAQWIGIGTDYEPRLWRRWAFSVGGAVTVGVPTLFAADDAKGECSTRRCQTLVAAVGGLLGFMIGWERDAEVSRLARVGPPVPFRSEARSLDFRPIRLVTAGPEGALVLGEAGLAALTAELELIRRGGEIRGISGAAALWENDLLLAAAPAGIYGFPLASPGVRGSPAWGERLSPLSAGSMVVFPSRDVVAVTTEGLIRLRTKRPDTAADEPGWAIAEMASAPAAAGVSALVPAGELLWTLEGRDLAVRDADRLETLAALRLPVQARRLAVADGVVAVAAGSNGVFLIDVRNPMSPRLLGQPRLESLRFANGLALYEKRLYVAGGTQGLVVVDVETPSNPRVLGVVRGVGTVDDVIAGPAGVYIIERLGRRIQRIGLMEVGAAQTRGRRRTIDQSSVPGPVSARDPDQ